MKIKRDFVIFLCGSFFSLILYNIYLLFVPLSLISSPFFTTTTTTSSSISIPMEAFPEPYWRTPQTLEALTVASSPFARFEIHKVLTEDGKIIQDWLWTDERSHVNIFVHLKEEDRFLLFYQKKYGYNGYKFATVGGLYDEGETAKDCAARELYEETGLITDELYHLGEYRVQVNRGGGFLHVFYARNSVWKNGISPLKKNTENNNMNKKKLKNDFDYETQEMKLFTRDQILELLHSGMIGEAQWLATIASGLLYEEKFTK